MTEAFRGGAIATALFPPRLARYEGDPPALVDEETPWRTMRFGIRMRKPDAVVMVVVEDEEDVHPPTLVVAQEETIGAGTRTRSQGRVVGLGQWTKPSPRMEAEVAADVKDAMESVAAAEAAAATATAPGNGQDTKGKDDQPPPQSLDVEALDNLVATIKEANERIFGPDHMKEMWCKSCTHDLCLLTPSPFPTIVLRDACRMGSPWRISCQADSVFTSQTSTS
jgi:hypothetical protein